MTNSTEKPARPSLYQTKDRAAPNSFSVVDAATVQGNPKRRKEATENAGRQAAAKKSSSVLPFAIVGSTMLIAGALTWYFMRDETPPAPEITTPAPKAPAASAPVPAAPAPTATVAPAPNAVTATPAVPAQPAANPGSAPASVEVESVPISNEQNNKSPAVEELGATPATLPPPPSSATSNPLKGLEADSGNNGAQAGQKAAAQHPHPKPAAAPAPAAATQAHKADSDAPTPAPKPAASKKAKPSRDDDVDFMQNVLDNLGKSK